MVILAGCTTAGRTLPPETEAELGNQLSEELDRSMFLLPETISATISRLGAGIAAGAAYPISPYSFRIVDVETVSAFAVAGGSVYLYRGLVEESGSMAEVAAVLGHEIAHLAAGHASHKLYEYQRRQLGLGQRMDRSRVLFLATYSRALEAEADSMAVSLMVAAGWHPAGLIRFFETLLRLRDHEPGILESPFLTHPMIEERIEAVQRVIDRYRPHQLAGLRRSSPAYDSLIARLDELPPPRRSEFR